MKQRWKQLFTIDTGLIALFALIVGLILGKFAFGG